MRGRSWEFSGKLESGYEIFIMHTFYLQTHKDLFYKDSDIAA